MLISLSRVHFPVTSLGPDKRIGIWFQGCSLRCVGCIATDTWAKKPSTTTVDELLLKLQPWLIQAQGITISGGEPFEQAPALNLLLQGLRQQVPHLDILLYSGWQWPAIAQCLANFTNTPDAIISGSFEQTQPQTLALRGSDNQQLHLLTELGQQRFAPYQTAQSTNQLDLMFDNGQIWLAGIPKRDDLKRLQQLLSAQQIQITTTEDKRHN